MSISFPALSLILSIPMSRITNPLNLFFKIKLNIYILEDRAIIKQIKTTSFGMLVGIALHLPTNHGQI